MRAAQVRQLLSLAGVGAGAWIVGYGLQWPIISGAAIYLALVPLLMWTMTEAGYQPVANQTGLGMFRSIVTPLRESVQLVRLRPILATILLVGAVIGLCIGGFDRLYAAHFTENFTLPQLGTLEPVAWFTCTDVPWLLYTAGLNLGGIGGDNANAMTTAVWLGRYERAISGV